MTTIFIVFTILIILLTLTMFITINFEYDILDNVGKIKIQLFKILTIFKSGITISDSYLNLHKKKNKVIKIKIDINDEKFKFIKDIQTNLIKNISPIDINLNMIIGGNNPVLGCLSSSTLNVLLSFLLLKISYKYDDVKINNNVKTAFRQNMIKINFKCSIIICLIDIIRAVFNAYIKGVKRKYEKRISKPNQQSSRIN